MRHISTYLILALLPASACTCAELAGPDAQLTQAARELAGLRELPGCGLHIRQLGISRVTPESGFAPPRVVFSVDLDGAIDGPAGQTIAVSAVGVERAPMQLVEGRWVPRGSPLPRLEATLRELIGREPPAGPPSARWLIRLDVRRIDVTEELSTGARRSFIFLPLGDGGVAEDTAR